MSRGTTKDAATRFVMSRPMCRGCDRVARPKSSFCTDRCAVAYIEELLLGNEEQWCPICGSWESTENGETLLCTHPVTSIKTGLSALEVRAFARFGRLGEAK